MYIFRRLKRWFIPGLGVKRWFLLLSAGIFLLALSIGLVLIAVLDINQSRAAITIEVWVSAVIGFMSGSLLVVLGLRNLVRRIVSPYRTHETSPIVDTLYTHSQRGKGLRVVAVGGGTGLPSVLRGMKTYTNNLTAIVTVADDGGSSGRLRREMGVLPPGDLRNNIVALADDESLMAQLFQYRFAQGDLKGHAFGNLFISALEAVTGSLEAALVETERVLNISGRVFPSTLQDVRLAGWVRPADGAEPTWVEGESSITEVGGRIDRICLEPSEVEAYPGSVDAILNADIIFIGPGSLYTSILPNLMVRGIADALRATSADIVYICNVATQPGETDNYTVADHVLAMERHIGRGVFRAVLANNAYPSLNAGENTHYVRPVPPHHEVLQRYEIIYTDLVNYEKPWRHDPAKLARAVMALRGRGMKVN